MYVITVNTTWVSVSGRFYSFCLSHTPKVFFLGFFFHEKCPIPTQVLKEVALLLLYKSINYKKIRLTTLRQSIPKLENIALPLDSFCRYLIHK